MAWAGVGGMAWAGVGGTGVVAWAGEGGESASSARRWNTAAAFAGLP